MVELRLKLPRGQNNIVWIPRQVSENFGRDLRILIAGMAGVLYSANADKSEVIASAQLIIKELELKAAHEAKQTKNL